jgi:toxin YoeB
VNILFTPIGWDDYQHWAGSDRSVMDRINALVDDLEDDPTGGLGKPERLQGALEGCWSRRISGDHRLVYLVKGSEVVILQARYHHR